MVETMKRRERERMMETVNSIIAAEREAILKTHRQTIECEVEEAKKVQNILAENQRKIEVLIIEY